MTSSDDYTTLVDRKVKAISARSDAEAWAACAAVWARVFVLASGGWARWPHLYDGASRALSSVLGHVTGAVRLELPGELLSKLDEFDVEDDGSADWQHVVDIISAMSRVLSGDDLVSCLTATLMTYLDSASAVIANDMSVAEGRPLPHTEVVARLATDARWLRAEAFIESL